ncbi:DExH-box splicing factor binding site-domain-containing protein [Daldinia vernicosa]|uniref:DExH-box splicing factor binding site-domain-containing protein n=1 Tax=Daldinia vernicosa TaxID=114800 RepID=UPI002007EA2C|nr:DExH-box splicing factor binding site-domain-containing protein [Daldinia vernicosa]KAI0846239.1 DExH-box splicing factor binding site-domain-containing protein [Daldinia vernicosa]
MTEPAPRIAIKFGTSSSSKSVNGAKKQAHSQPPSTLGKRQRPHVLSHDSDSGSDDEARHEVITTIGDDVSESEAKRRNLKTDKSGRANAPYVITGHKNRDWKAELKSQKSTRDSLPSRRAESGDSAERDPADQDKQIKWGLTVTKKPVQDDPDNPDESPSRDEGSTTADRGVVHPSDESEVPANEDTDAIDALLGKKRKFTKDLVIEGKSSHSTPTTLSEQDAYRRRMEEAAEVSTIDEYDQIPEGEFGAAMLRGMGWNGEERGAKPKEVKKRPNLMGLGSKEDEEIRKGELARKHGHREHRPRLNEYRRDKEKERRDRDDRRGDSYKSERERERRDYGHSHHRDRDRDSHRHSERSYRR